MGVIKPIPRSSPAIYRIFSNRSLGFYFITASFNRAPFSIVDVGFYLLTLNC